MVSCKEVSFINYWYFVLVLTHTSVATKYEKQVFGTGTYSTRFTIESHGHGSILKSKKIAMRLYEPQIR